MDRSARTVHPTTTQSTKPINHNTLFHPESIKMTRSHKANEVNHQALAAGTATAQDRLPKFFGKHGLAGTDPKKVKKNGAGKGGWGVEGEEIQDSEFVMNNARRRSNSSSYAAGLKDFKTKFEGFDPEPVFEESIHGPQQEQQPGSPTSTHSDSQFNDASSIEKVNTISSESSVEEEEKAKTK